MRITSIAAGFAALTLLTTGCSSPEAATPTASESSPGARTGGMLRVVDYLAWYCLAPSGMGAYANSVIGNQVLDRLVYQDPVTAELSGWLAESWQVNDDLTEYTFTIRDGVEFTDGTPLTAEVVKANLDQIAQGAPDQAIPAWSTITTYQGAEVVDERTVKVRLTETDADFLQALSMPEAGIVSTSTLALPYEDQCQAQNVVATGPFVFDSERPGKEITYRRNDAYDWAPPAVDHDGPALLDGFVETIVDEGSVRTGSLTSGQADIARGILPTDEALVAAAPGYTIEPIASNVVNQLIVYPDHPNLDDPRVRRALNLAADRQEIHDTLLTENYPIPTSVLATDAPGWADHSEALAYDLDAARKLLDEAGWTEGADGYRTKDGERLTIDAFISPHHITAKGVMELLQVQWKRAGIELRLKSADASTWNNIVTDTAVNAFNQTSQIRFAADALRTTWHSEARNAARRGFADLDKVLTTMNSSTDAGAREQAAAQAQSLVIDKGLTVPLYEDSLIYGRSEQVRDLGHEGQGRPFYLTTWLDD